VEVELEDFSSKTEHEDAGEDGVAAEDGVETGAETEAGVEDIVELVEEMDF
jgi:hypothetical protein